MRTAYLPLEVRLVRAERELAVADALRLPQQWQVFEALSVLGIDSVVADWLVNGGSAGGYRRPHAKSAARVVARLRREIAAASQTHRGEGLEAVVSAARGAL